MPTFQYQARTMHGERVRGTLEAPTEVAVDEALRSRGFLVTRIRVDTARRAAYSQVKLRRQDLALFTMHLATVLRSGLPLSFGLLKTADHGFDARIQAVAKALLDQVEEGKLLSEAMAGMPRAFPEFYVNMIKAGETVGQLDQVLFDLLASIEWQMNLRAEIRQASMYPAILLTLLFALTIGIATIVMPRFVTALSRAGMKLPPSALFVVAAGEFATAHWLQILVGLVWIAVAIRLAVDTPRGRYRLDYVKLRLPLFGNLARQVALSRFAHHLRMMVKSGVSFVVALNVVEHVMGNRVLAAAVASARERVFAGSSLADALKETGQFTPLVIQMVATGEVAGSLEDTLKKVTDYYDREVPAAVKRISTAIEPVVYIILGVVVLAVALTLYSPLLSMMNQIQTRPRF